MKLHLSQLDSPLGAMLLVTDMQQTVRALDFADHRTRLHRGLRQHYGAVELIEAGAPAEIAEALTRYFNGELAALDALRTATAGPGLQRRVWAALRRVSAGTTTTYGELARELGFDDPRAAIDIGAANGANPIAIIVPCHRVIARNGDLKGYAWGLQRKRWLLAHEKAMAPKAEAPQTAMLPGLFGADAARQLARQPLASGSSRVALESTGLGRGELFYFGPAMPTPLAHWRPVFYRRLAFIANRWNEALGVAHRFPAELEAFLLCNRKAGQTRSQSHLSRLGVDDHVLLHQRNDGEQVFPLQIVVLLSEPGRDFEGGEFVMTEQRPRMQSRPAVLPLGRDDAAIITTAQRPVKRSQGGSQGLLPRQSQARDQPRPQGRADRPGTVVP